ncbi:MAG: MBL fold metallo-hydrolase [Lachnospiraceae bacterium]|nr:MBL fold metallo-hydrolase [Lachnospiraceae bacterium]
MAGLRVEQYVVGPVMTNCYFAVNEDTNEMFIVDPGAWASELIQRVSKCGAAPVAVLLTHGHFDHASAARALAEEYGIQIYAHEAEKETLENPDINLCGMVRLNEVYSADCYVKDGEILNIAGFEIKVLHTPGHTKGGCCYYIEKEQAVFSGDTLFNASVGRTDFPGGSASVLLRSIEEKLLPMPGQTKVYPGHNDTTTIGWEKQYNPFL